MGSHRRPPLPRVFVTHYLAVAKWLCPNMQEITRELYLARWAHILIWLEAEADWINLGERWSVWGPGRTFSPKFPEVLWPPRGFYCGLARVPSLWRLKKGVGLWVLGASRRPVPALKCTGDGRGVSPPRGPLDMVPPLATMLPSTLPPPAPCSRAALVPQPLPKHRDRGPCSSWSPWR